MLSVTFKGFEITGAVQSKCCKSLLIKELSYLLILSAVSVSESQLFFKVPPSFLIIYYIIYILLYINKLRDL